MENFTIAPFGTPESNAVKITFCLRVYDLTVCYLKLGLCHDAACHSERLADVIACVGALHRRNSQLSVHGHRDPAVFIRRLVGKQKLLQREMGTIIYIIIMLKVSNLSCTIIYLKLKCE